MSGGNPLFTVFTPTYNRADTLHRVYESLLAQTFKDFEWVVVDDGSTDPTSALVKQWQADQQTWFPIRYFYQDHQHKKTAHNHGVRVAQGQLFLPADSDDRFPPNALERFARHWAAISEHERRQFAGVCGLCEYENGCIVGDRFPAGEWIDSDSLEMRYRHRVRGEKWGFTRTDIVRDFLFPEHISGYVPEEVVWSPISARYKTRFVNEVFRTYCQETGSGSEQITSSRKPTGAAPGMVYWKQMVLSDGIGWFRYAPIDFLLDAARLTRFRLHLRQRSVKQSVDGFWPRSWGGRVLVAIMAPAGLAWWLYDRLQDLLGPVGE